MQGLGDLPGGDFESAATAVNGEGSVIVGTSRTDREIPFEHFDLWGTTLATNVLGLLRWDGGVMTQLEFPDAALGPITEIAVNAVSSNGSVVVGTFLAPWQFEGDSAIWLGHRLQAISPQQDGISGHNDVSSSGLIVVGYAFGCDCGIPFEATRSSPWGPPLALGNLPGFSFQRATAVSGNGEFIAGLASNGPGPDVPFVSAGARLASLASVLQDGFGFDVSDWDFNADTSNEGKFDLSFDGSTLVGTARNPAGAVEAFRVRATPEEWDAAVQTATLALVHTPALRLPGAIALVVALLLSTVLAALPRAQLSRGERG